MNDEYSWEVDWDDDLEDDDFINVLRKEMKLK